MSVPTPHVPPPPGDRGARLVSVVVAAHNAEATLEETCLAALGQTHRALELIVVDDGSTDRTVDIVARLAAADPRVRLISQQNLGVAAARNAGIAVAQGEFIAPLDADDLWDVTKIARQVQRFEDCGPATGVVYAWWAWLDAANRVIDRSPQWRVEGRVLDRLLEVNFTGCASVPLFRRSCVVEAGGYDSSLLARDSQGCEDWDLVLRVAERHEVGVAPAVLVGYRRYAGSMSTSTDTMWRSQVAVTDAVASRQPSLSGHVLRRSRGQFALYLAGVAFWSGDYVRAFQWGFRARPWSLMLSIVPHVLRLFARRWSVRRAPVLSWPPDGSIATMPLPDPLVPYERIYDTHWRRHASVDVSAGADRETTGAMAMAQMAGVVVAVALVAGLHWPNDGLWFQGDAPRHAVTGLFYWDMVSATPADPLGYALSYYARYPVIVPGAYPPLFHLLEGLAFRVAGPSPVVAKALVWLFAAVAGFYAMRWGRRWIAPWAGWAGALTVMLPGFVRYSNGVLLNVPATALGLAALYHLRACLESGRQRDSRLCAGLTVATVATYLPGAIILPVAFVWLMPASARARVRSLWLLPAVLLAGLAATAAFVPSHLMRHLPSPDRLFSVWPWAFYGQQVAGLVGGPWLALAGAGLVAALMVPARRPEATRLLLAAVAVVVALVMLPAFDSRYALILVPVVVFAALLGGAAVGDVSGAWRRPAGAVALLVLLGFTGWQAARTSLPQVSGVAQVAQYLRQQGPSDSVLYSGSYDGVFGFYLRALDAGMERRMVLASKLLYGYKLNQGFVWEETSFVTSPDDVVTMIATKSGCRWIAVEVTPEEHLPQSERLLRQALRGPAFELAATFAVTAGEASRIEVYRFLPPVTQVTTVDLQFPSFSDRVFTGVTPVTLGND